MAQRLLRGWQEPPHVTVARLGSRGHKKNNPRNIPYALFISIDKHLDFTVLDGSASHCSRLSKRRECARNRACSPDFLTLS